MLGKLSWEDESDSRLDLSGAEGLSLVVLNKFTGFTSEFTEDVVNEGVHNGHGSLGDTGLWVNLLQDSVDIDGEGLCSLLVSSEWSLLGWGVSSGFSWHFNLNLLSKSRLRGLKYKFELKVVHIQNILVSDWTIKVLSGF